MNFFAIPLEMTDLDPNALSKIAEMTEVTQKMRIPV
jgi:hypothetical protein